MEMPFHLKCSGPLSTCPLFFGWRVSDWVVDRLGFETASCSASWSQITIFLPQAPEYCYYGHEPQTLNSFGLLSTICLHENLRRLFKWEEKVLF